MKEKKYILINQFIESLDEAELLSEIKDLSNNRDLNNEVSHITFNSKDVVNGTLFVCKGINFKKDYLIEALENGSIVYIMDEKLAAMYSNETKKYGAIGIIVKDIRKTMPVIVRTFYGDLPSEIDIVGITGTKGKSTTAYFVRGILDDYLKSQGKKSSAICSGIENYDGISIEESHNTTPEIMEIYYYMDNAVSNDIDYMTMEVSSQALKVGRVEGIKFKVATFLNIGEDHVSPIEHPDYEDYFNSKLKIFDNADIACVNMDSDRIKRIMKRAGKCSEIISFSKNNKNANVYCKSMINVEGSPIINVCVNYKDMKIEDEVHLAVFGSINLENALAAISICVALNIPFEYIKSGLSKVKVPGRMEIFRSSSGDKIAVVDYAHNKMSFDTFYSNIKKDLPKRDVITVFGSTGGKALDRREGMGISAGKNSIYSIVTSDDPGEEDAFQICLEIGKYIEQSGGKYEIIVNREEAVKKAVSMLDDKNLLFLAGKGRENMQKIGKKKIKIKSDVELVEELIG